MTASLPTPGLPKRTRAIVYIDGFNLYYGALKGTAYKWLDLDRYFRMLRPADPLRCRGSAVTRSACSMRSTASTSGRSPVAASQASIHRTKSGCRPSSTESARSTSSSSEPERAVVGGGGFFGQLDRGQRLAQFAHKLRRQSQRQFVDHQQDRIGHQAAADRTHLLLAT